MQKLAWERHGFRAANFAGTDSISRFGVAGTLDQIPAVSELPNNDAMQHLITTLQSAQAKLVADISMYDTMYTQNAQQYRELKMTVLAGKKALADFNANQLPALEAEAAASGDAMQAQVLKNFKSKLDRFAKRLDDLDRISVVPCRPRRRSKSSRTRTRPSWTRSTPPSPPRFRCGRVRW